MCNSRLCEGAWRSKLHADAQGLQGLPASQNSLAQSFQWPGLDPHPSHSRHASDSPLPDLGVGYLQAGLSGLSGNGNARPAAEQSLQETLPTSASCSEGLVPPSFRDSWLAQRHNLPTETGRNLAEYTATLDHSLGVDFSPDKYKQMSAMQPVSRETTALSRSDSWEQDKVIPASPGT